MMLLRRILQYRVYRRLVLSYLTLSIVTIALLSTILYAMFSARAVDEIDSSSKQMLTQVSYTSNVVYDQVKDITSQLLSDNEIISFLYAKEDNKKTNYTAYLFLNRLQGVYPFIKNISLYNFTTGTNTDLLGLTPTADMMDQLQKEGSSIGFIPRQVETMSKIPLKLLTFKITPEISFTEKPKGAIVVDLDEAYIRNIMKGISASARDALTLVMDTKGTIISHSDPDHFMEDFSDKPYIARILKDKAQSGSFVQRIEGQKELVTYVKSANLDWYFITVRPYSEIISNIDQLRNWTILIAVLLIIAGAFISLLLTGNMYNPVKALLDKVSTPETNAAKPHPRVDEYKLLTDAFTNTMESAKSMADTIQASSQALKDSYIAYLLNGGTKQLAVSAEMKREWESRFSGPFLTVVLFKIDNYAAFHEKHHALDRGLIRFAISNIAGELLSKPYRADTANIAGDEVTLILQTDSPHVEDNLFLIFGEIQDALLRYYAVSVSVSIGDSCASLSEIRHSYETAKASMTSRLFLGHGCIVDSRTAAKQDGQQERYPMHSEKRLIDAVKQSQTAKMKREIESFLAFLQGCSYANAIQYTQFIVLGVIKEFEYVTEWWNVDAEQLYRATRHMQSVETMADIERLLLGLCQQIVEILEENKKNTYVVKNAKIIETIQLFVQERYAEHGLSLEAAAENVGFSTGYIGKLFKNMTGTTFNDYVTHIRLEQAKVLLATTTDTIAAVGEAVGVYNVSYFTTLFKKKYGITPSVFKEQAAHAAE
ncbi:cache domain-containing protein [Paenibacillus taihuensis]|uniref:Cache domain-containing protein n=1 Tax=Paenibacillus taihuensis TaxID=1156355 RepID=A0A3D9Q119_9BACL|nr:helix-turn-helix domain-containing protein [Paenibacillus taihuensis]REE56272.1 cache domain-containing protein [Paenibacillus taihuensis]